MIKTTKTLLVIGLILVGGIGVYMYYKPAALQEELAPNDQPSPVSEDTAEPQAEPEGVVEEILPENAEETTGENSALRETSPDTENETLREAACPVPGPACPSPQTPVCHDGKWYCREHVGGGAAGARVSQIDELNFPNDAALREGACAEPALACEVPSIPECKNGKWVCVPPAIGGAKKGG